MNKNKDKALTWAAVAMLIKDKGYRYLGAYFDGSGDSGYIEQIVASNNLEELENNDVWNIINGESLTHLDLSDDLQTFISDEFDTISASQDDWWNDDGGFGKCIIDLNNNSYDLDIDLRITDHVNYHYDDEALTK